MRCREAIDPALPIPELIKLIRHSFRQCEFDEVQNILMEREMRMQVEIENVVRDRNSLKKRVDFLENTHGYLELQKCDLNEKLARSQRRGEELDEKIVQSKEKFEKLLSEKLGAEEKLRRSQRELDENIVQLKEKFDKLRSEKLDVEEKLRRRGEELDEKIVQSKEKFEKLKSEKLDVEEKLKRSQRRGQELDERIVQSKEKFEKLWSEKLFAEETLRRSQRRGVKLDEKIVQSNEKFEKLRNEKLEIEEKLRRSQRRGEEWEKMIVRMKEEFEKLCEEMDERVVKMGKEIEELRREKLCASKTIEELKAKEIEADLVQGLKHKDVETVKTIDEFRTKKKKKCEKANAEDRAIILSPQVPVTTGAGVGTLAHSVTKGDDEGKEPIAISRPRLTCELSRYRSSQVHGVTAVEEQAFLQSQRWQRRRTRAI